MRLLRLQEVKAVKEEAAVVLAVELNLLLILKAVLSMSDLLVPKVKSSVTAAVITVAR
jgi:hypothetical protein